MTPAFGTVHVFDDGDALARGAADWLVAHTGRMTDDFVLSLSGGSTPKRLYSLLADAAYVDRFPWGHAEFTFGDERFLPPDDPASNAHMATEAMFSRAPLPPENVHRVSTVGISPEAAASEYEATLRRLYGADTLDPARPLFEVTLLGLGEDGHTASLIPGQKVLQERTRWVQAVPEGRPETRITLTYPAIDSSRFVVFLVQGEGKRAVLDRILSGDDTLPASRVRPVGSVLWMLDRAAAGRWAEDAT